MKQSTEAFATLNLTVPVADFIARLNQAVVQALVIPFLVVVLDELCGGSSQRGFPEEDHAIQALALHRLLMNRSMCAFRFGDLAGKLDGISHQPV